MTAAMIGTKVNGESLALPELRMGQAPTLTQGTTSIIEDERSTVGCLDVVSRWALARGLLFPPPQRFA
jgi:hypothetical protein